MRTATCHEHGRQPHDVNGRCQVCEYAREMGVKLKLSKDPATQKDVYRVVGRA